MIKNFNELTSSNKACKDCREARIAVLQALNEGLKLADPEVAVSKALSVEGDNVICGRLRFKPKRVFVIGAGKAAYRMARAALRILGERVSKGVISIPRGVEYRELGNLKVIVSGHPKPDSNSIKAGSEIIKLCESAREEDLIIALISGGGSALLELPIPPITLEDLKKTTEVLLRCGADIKEVNTVRKHLSQVKGGRLVEKAYPAQTIALILSDVVGDPIEFIASGPTAPDTTTYQDAKRVLEKYNVWNRVPASIREVIVKGLRGDLKETPKPGDSIFEKVENKIVASNRLSLEAMREKLRSLGFKTLILSSRVEGEAKSVGLVLGGILLESWLYGDPLEPPMAIVGGGETTVTVKGKGRGGRNQELTMVVSRVIRGAHGIAFSAIDSDGIDGVTDVAGAIVDAHSYSKSLELGLDFEKILEDNNSYEYFKTLKDHVITGVTGTNVNDLHVGVVTVKR